MSNESRTSMVRSAAALIGSRGVNATSFTDVLADSGAPRGSIYHHFPEGKRQLTEDAIRLTSEQILDYLRAAPTDSAESVLLHFIALWRGSAGCPVAGVAVDTVAGEPVMELVRASFRSWSDMLAAQLAETGVPAARAASIAVTALAGMEGALILCRAEGSDAPLDAVGEELLRLVRVSL
jgi:TetR/AcrR family transcriptional regulator, lmrAB and yxaGH operons repressor